MTLVTFILVVIGCYIYFGLEALTKSAKKTSSKLDDAWDNFCAHPLVRGFFITCIVVGVGILFIIIKGF